MSTQGGVTMSWLLLAIVLEVCGTTSMKLSEGFAKLLPSILIFVFYGLSFASLTIALKSIDVSIAYAVWSGVGTALIAAIDRKSTRLNSSHSSISYALFFF